MKILPQSVINKLRDALSTPEQRRARSIGIGRKKFKEFMSDPDAALNTKELHLFGAKKKTSFLRESKAFIIESVFDDAYQLEKIPLPRDKHCRILDIGANIGAFTMAARAQFPNATIHAYEPNPNLEQHLRLQAYAAGAKYYMEAVGKQEGFFSTDEMQNEILQSESVKIMDFTKSGNIKAVSLKTAIERMGGYVDLLKLDCEGSEWVILQDKESLQHVNYITAEFHRFSPDGGFDMYDRSIDIHAKARKFIEDSGFTVLFERYHTVDGGIFVAKKNVETFPFDLAKIKEHIDRRFSETKVDLDPFPHIVISEILPSEVYSYLVSQWPEEEVFDRNSTLRKRLPVTQGCAENRSLSVEQRIAWKTFGERIVQGFIQDNIKKRFIPISHYKFPFLSEDAAASAVKNIDFDHSYSDGLNLDKFGFSINPHIDQAYIFSTILTYFPPDSQHAEYGTTLYRSKSGRTSKDILYCQFKECEVVKKVPFVPNTMLAYLQAPNGWHGVDRITEKGYLRKSYLSLLNLKYEQVESIYGSDVYKAEDLHKSEHRYLDPKNFNKQ